MRRRRKRYSTIPNAIWMPTFRNPSCYQGTPIEMVEQMADEMKPGLGVDDTIDLIARILADERGVTQIFTGRRGRSRLAALLFGSVASTLVQVSPVPVTVVP